MTGSLCETCSKMQLVVTQKGSRFLLSKLSKTDSSYPKYPRQPVIRCGGYQQKDTGEAKKD
jgi:hypothetical protein